MRAQKQFTCPCVSEGADGTTEHSGRETETTIRQGRTFLVCSNHRPFYPNYKHSQTYKRRAAIEAAEVRNA